MKTKASKVSVSKRTVPRPTDAEIRQMFNALGLANLNQSTYPGALAITRKFERCSLYEHSSSISAAHTGN